MNSDQATGSDFDIAGATQPTPTPSPSPSVTPSPSPTVEPSPSPTAQPSPSPTPNDEVAGRFDERYSGTLNPGQPSVEIPFELRRSRLDAQISQNHRNQQISLELLDEHGKLIAVANGNKLFLEGLPTGKYVYRIRGSVTKSVDFTIKSGQDN